ncbi:ABC transporter permease [Nevskia soli]|uniref:ABC transporter permease n=1 Tax=Nevskia soli TaxID=418856 RepID=UPI0004A726EB|nr:FtsX-like permease family protein [Nevskia soli]
MHFGPILSAMRRNKVGAFLIALQMALTLAILCNALFIIRQRVVMMARPSGVDEANTFSLSNQWVGSPEQIGAMIRGDLAALRGMPGVVDAYATNAYPLRGGGWSEGIGLAPNQKHSSAHTARYFTDDHALNALGAHLIAGRNFTADEIRERSERDKAQPGVMIVTKAVGEKLFPDGSALGKTVYVEDQPIVIVGIVDMLKTPWVSNAWAEKFVENSMLDPYIFISKQYSYIVRAQPGQLDAVMQAAQKKLFEVNRNRVIEKVRSYAQIRADAYRNDRALAIILGTVSAALLAVTAFGIVGLTSFWVTQRRRQIGVRRALGATRRAILAYFQTENSIIAGVGALLGMALAVGLNLWMVQALEMQRLDLLYVLCGAVAVMLLGQFAVLWPALRAASTPPALATRAS